MVGILLSPRTFYFSTGCNCACGTWGNNKMTNLPLGHLRFKNDCLKLDYFVLHPIWNVVLSLPPLSSLLIEAGVSFIPSFLAWLASIIGCFIHQVYCSNNFSARTILSHNSYFDTTLNMKDTLFISSFQFKLSNET